MNFKDTVNSIVLQQDISVKNIEVIQSMIKKDSLIIFCDTNENHEVPKTAT